MKNPNKKQQKAANALRRVRVEMNTGTRVFKSAKNPTREEQKQTDRRLISGGDM